MTTMFGSKAISPFLEMGAYEHLWASGGQTFKRLAQKLEVGDGSRRMPSEFVTEDQAAEAARKAISVLKDSKVGRFGVRISGAGNYPERLRDAKDPLKLVYYQGNWDLVETRGIAVVGARKASKEGLKRADKLARMLVDRDFTVVSGLAEGIDTAAHRAAIEAGGRTVAVLGTPLSDVFPKANRELQQTIARDHLLISQVPVLVYRSRDYRWNRMFFPARNVTMSALTEATIIVEAGDTSGTLTQAKAALDQGRKLFILNNIFETHDWPKKFESQGAVRASSFEDILQALEPKPANTGPQPDPR